MIRLVLPKQPAVFVDLVGTLVLPIRAGHPSEYHAIANAVEAVALLCGAGYLCVVVTVQSRIEKGLFSGTDFVEWFRLFSDEFAAECAFLKGPYVCPHRFKTRCSCKKESGLLYQGAANDLGIDVRNSFVIGDTREDMAAAKAIGCPGVMVRTGWPVPLDGEVMCDYVADDVLAAAHWILRTHDSDR